MNAEIPRRATSIADFALARGVSPRDRYGDLADYVADRMVMGRFPYRRLAASPGAPETAIEGSGRPLANFASQDYLGLSRHPRIVEVAHFAIERHGVHSAGSPSLLGTTVALRDLERELARRLGKEDAAVFPTGWAAGFAVTAGLAVSADALILDVLAHRCLVDGARQVAGDDVEYFAHNDLDHLESVLRRVCRARSQSGVFVVVESLYSMDSDSPELPRLVDLCRRYDAIAVLDIAHDFGAMGEKGLGLLETSPSDRQPEIIVGSFSKTFAATGGFIASDRATIERIRCFGSTLMFSNALAPMQAEVAIECCRVVFSPEGAALRESLRDVVSELRSGLQSLNLDVMGMASAIVPVSVGDDDRTMRVATRLADCGLLANLVEHPAVPRGKSRFRLQAMATHRPNHVAGAVKAFAAAIREVRES